MKRWIRTVLLVALCAVWSAGALHAQSKKVTTALQSSANGAQGTEFIVAFPLNDGSPLEADPQMEIYIATSYDQAVVDVQYLETNSKTRYIIVKDQIRTLNAGNGGVNPSWEIEANQSEIVTQKGIIITSDKPISVYVINAKSVSSDGYLALPTSVWGRRYLSIGYYDFAEFNNNYTWAGGFCVLAKEDFTEVRITLRGQGDAATRLGKRIGESYTVTLQRGETFLVMGDGLTRGDFDITGSEITANKPIGLLSFHARTALPNATPLEGRDHLIEMTPPVSAWGKEYVTLEYSRAPQQGKGKGDYYRVVAAEDGTIVRGAYYTKVNPTLIGNLSTPPLRAGQFIDFTKTAGFAELPNGVVTFSGNKPFFVMQYSTSASFDGDNQNDPFMCNVTPVEQYITETIFQTPTLSNYNRHLLNIVIQALDPDPAKQLKDLESIEVDGETVYNSAKQRAPNMLTTSIPGRPGMYFATIEFGEVGGEHIIRSNGRVRFGGYIYGFGNFDSYGWPAAAAFRDVSTIDTVPPPIIQLREDCGDYDFRTTELVNIPNPPQDPPTKDSNQVDTGIFSIILEAGSTNYTLNHVTVPDGNYPRSPKATDVLYNLRVINKEQDAVAYVRISDYADNFTYDTLRYFADKITTTPDPLDFGRIRLGTTKDLPLTLRNNGDAPITVSSLAILPAGSKFSIVSGGPAPLNLAPGQEVVLTIRYNGDEETTDPAKDWDSARVVMEAGCSDPVVDLVGMAVMPRITVDDYDAGTLGVNEQHCLTNGLRITNPGTADLVISAISGVVAPFSLSDPTVPAVTFTIPPKGQVLLKTACYQSPTVGSSTIDVTFTTNGAEGDSVSKWSGLTQAPGPFIKGHDFGARRENTVVRFLATNPTVTSDGVIFNTGTQSITLTTLEFSGGGKYWPAGSNEGNYTLKLGDAYLNGALTALPIAMNSTGGTPNQIVAYEIFYRAGQGIPVSQVSQNVRATFAEQLSTEGVILGSAMRPAIALNVVTLSCDDTPAGIAVTSNLTITNSGTEVLTVTNLVLNGAPTEWQFVPAVPATITVAPNGSESFPIVFTRPNGNTGGFSQVISATHDAVAGNGTDETITPAQETTTWTVGSCSGPMPAVTNIPYPQQRANCDAPVLTFTISNTGGGSSPLEIRDLIIVDADAPAFTIESIVDGNGTVATVPFFIAAGQTYTVSVRFTPDQPRAYNARVRVMNYVSGEATEIVPDLHSILTGSAIVTPVQFDLTNDVNGAESRDIGANVIFGIQASSANWPAAEVTNVTYVVEYDTRNLAYVPGSVGVINGWTAGEPTIATVDANRSTMTFTASGPALSANATVLTFNTTLLLADKISSTQALAVDGLRACVVPSTSGDSTITINCAKLLRVVSISRNAFALRTPSPNPSTGGDVTVEFGVGIDQAMTTVDVVNAQGVVVATLVNTPLPSGQYALTFPTTTIPSGAYFVRMTSSDFRSTQRLMIVD